MPHAIGTRLEIQIDEVLFRESHDPFEPKWAIAIEANGNSHLLYGVRHEIPARTGMRAIMEFRRNGLWVLVKELAN